MLLLLLLVLLLLLLLLLNLIITIRILLLSSPYRVGRCGCSPVRVRFTFTHFFLKKRYLAKCVLLLL